MRTPLRRTPSRALGLAFAVALLACPKADEPKAPPAGAQAEAPAAAPAAPSAAAPAFSAGDVRALVAPVALYPDPLLAVVLQSSTQPLQVVGAGRFLSQRQSDTSLAPDPAWDPSVTALLNYPELVTMLSDSLDWTEALGAATLDQLGDVQGSVQEIRFSSYNLGILRSNDVQEVLVRQSVVAIVPKDPNQVSIPSYDGAELLAAIDRGESMAVTAAQEAAPAAAEAAPAAIEEEAAPPPAAAPAAAPTYAAAPVQATPPAYAPPVSYSEPQSSFWTNAAIFTGGAVIGGLLGYAIGDDDDDDDDDNGGYYGWGGGGNAYYSDDDININGDVTINKPGNVQRELNNRVRPGTRPQPYAGSRTPGRAQPKPLARPAGPPGARPSAKPGRAPAHSVQLPKPAGKPAGVASKLPAGPKPVGRPATGKQTARRDGGGAFSDRPSPTKVAKESGRGARSRQSAAKPAATRAPQTASRQLQKQHKQGKAGGLSRQSGGGGGSAKAQGSRGKKSRGKG